MTHVMEDLLSQFNEEMVADAIFILNNSSDEKYVFENLGMREEVVLPHIKKQKRSENYNERLKMMRECWAREGSIAGTTNVICDMIIHGDADIDSVLMLVSLKKDILEKKITERITDKYSILNFLKNLGHEMDDYEVFIYFSENRQCKICGAKYNYRANDVERRKLSSFRKEKNNDYLNIAVNKCGISIEREKIKIFLPEQENEK